MLTSNIAVAEKLSRVIGLVEGREAGPSVVAIGGMHGNEPAGVEALRQIIENLEAKSRYFKGRFLALRGNISALEQQVRYIDEDMNRIWFPSIIEDIRQKPAREIASSERREIKALLNIIDKFLPEQSSHPVVIADLHSFSAEGSMFAITAPNPKHIHLFSKLHVPLIFGVEKTLRGAALRYYQDRGYITFALEGGQHLNDETIKNNAAAMLAMLDEIGCIDTSDLPAFSRHERYLKEQNKRLPAQVKLVYQHLVEPNDNFKMRPGYENFQRINKGEWLADDKSGKIFAECDGYILMPLYQEQGNDGFFVAQQYEYKENEKLKTEH